jgi:hypothetical protein
LYYSSNTIIYVLVQYVNRNFKNKGKRVLVFEVAGHPIRLPVQADGKAQKLPDKLRQRTKRLVDMGIIEHTDRSKYVLLRGF